MSKPRAQTLQQRFGFADTDLKTPKHDEIMLWLDSRVDSIVNMFFGPQWPREDIERIKRRFHDRSIVGEIPPRQKPKIIDRVWEKPVISTGYKSTYIIGFVDLAVEIREHDLGLDHWPQSEWDQTIPKWEADYSYESTWMLFEAKAAIPSLGELIRQIRMYQQYQRGRYVVVSPDDRFAEAIKAQGIAFVQYPK